MFLRVRPIIWLLLALSCAGVLIFALNIPAHAPVLMQVHLDQPRPTASGITTVTLHLTDPEGLPIEQARIISSANMTNMKMGEIESSVKEVGQGKYTAKFQFNMAGQWAITLLTHANGFEPLSQTIQLEVSPSDQTLTRGTGPLPSVVLPILYCA